MNGKYSGACCSSSNILRSRPRKSVIIILLVLSLYFSLLAESEIAGYPIIGYENETGFYMGGMGYLRNRPKHFNETIPLNTYYLSFEYSAKKQFTVKFEPELHLKNGNYSLNSTLNFRRWPSLFYGIGNNSLVEDAENFTPLEFGCSFDIKRKINSRFNVSLIYDFSYYEITKMKEGGKLISGSIPGSKGGFNSGLGLEISYDSRNAESYPTKGEHFSFRAMNYNKIIGSDYNINQYSFDLKKLFSLADKHVLALQGYACFTYKNPPFYSMPHLNKHMRGMTPNLHIDKQIAVLRIEYRVFPWEKGFFRRIGFVIFAENGQVADEPRHLSISNTRSDFGFGLRYSYFLEDRLNMRIDVGFGEENWNVSISTGEAF